MGEVVSRKVRRRRALAVALGGSVLFLFLSCQNFRIPNTVTPSTTRSTSDAFAAAIELPPASPGLSTTDLKQNAVATLVDPDWVTSTSRSTGIPARALAAYAGVALGLAAVKPTCHLSWNTLAGIGWIESHHGTIFGGGITPSGIAQPPIYGIPLDGKNNTKAMADFDHGDFDGTAEFDRAVGPMQIVPRTWAAWHADGNNDGDEDGQNIDDATLAAGRYLCYSGGDLSTKEGWQKALWSYNQTTAYMMSVADKANEYAN